MIYKKRIIQEKNYIKSNNRNKYYIKTILRKKIL